MVDNVVLNLLTETSEKERLNLHRILQSARDFIEASIFDTAKVQAVAKLEKAWVRFLKEDLKAFLEYVMLCVAAVVCGLGYAHACVCVRDREREREHVCVCVQCVCVARTRACGCMHVYK